MKSLHASGKRKRAVARATLKQGKGKITVNKKSLDIYTPALARSKIMEPLILAGEISKKMDVAVNVNGGGVMSQAEAVRLAIARALVKHSSSLKSTFMEYDRHLLVADVRRKEPCKPNDSKARAKRAKSYR